MCIYRLHYPKDLSEETAQYLRGRIAEKLAFFVEQLGERGELMTLQWMCELGFFDRDNIDDPDRVALTWPDTARPWQC